MHSLLNTWKYREDKLASIRKNLCDKGVSSEAAIADTWIDQQRNNRAYNNIWKKLQHRRVVSGLV
jgi:hypothetical protein